MKHIVKLGVGEILLTSMDKDGSRSGFDYKLIKSFKQGLGVPIVACGGAGSLEDFRSAIDAGASAVAAGAMFFFKGSFNAVLINYPDQRTLKDRVYYIQ
jgi:cyclase